MANQKPVDGSWPGGHYSTRPFVGSHVNLLQFYTYYSDNRLLIYVFIEITGRRSITKRNGSNRSSI